MEILLQIIDDPSNVSVFKGPGHFAATRAESAIRKLQEVYPTLRFEIVSDGMLSNLRARAAIPSTISSDEFSGALDEALKSTGTRCCAVTMGNSGLISSPLTA